MTTLELLQERARTGLDLSPGDELCARAATEIEALQGRIDAMEVFCQRYINTERYELRRQNAELRECLKVIASDNLADIEAPFDVWNRLTEHARKALAK